MLDVAQKYSNELKLKFDNIMYDLKYQYYESGYSDEYTPSNTNWNLHEFVSLDNEGNILGYIIYSISRNSYTACCLKIINFSNNKITFGKDVFKAINDIFTKYNLNKLSYGVYIGNPIEQTYDKLTKKYGGRIVGTKLKDARLLDGKYYDFKMYEILRDDYLEIIS
jgi:hypothetical protein